MPESKRQRQPARTPQEKLEDAFMDLSVHEQVKALETFQTLHRMKVRLNREVVAKVLKLPGVTIHEAVDDAQGTLINEESSFSSLHRMKRRLGDKPEPAKKDPPPLQGYLVDELLERFHSTDEKSEEPADAKK